MRSVTFLSAGLTVSSFVNELHSSFKILISLMGQQKLLQYLRSALVAARAERKTGYNSIFANKLPLPAQYLREVAHNSRENGLPN